MELGEIGRSSLARQAGVAGALIVQRAPPPLFGECAAGRRSRLPGRPGTNPGANDI